jgi:hypothetical protein
MQIVQQLRMQFVQQIGMQAVLQIRPSVQRINLF